MNFVGVTALKLTKRLTRLLVGLHVPWIQKSMKLEQEGEGAAIHDHASGTRQCCGQAVHGKPLMNLAVTDVIRDHTTDKENVMWCSIWTYQLYDIGQRGAHHDDNAPLHELNAEASLQQQVMYRSR